MTDAQTLLQEGLSAFRARAYDQALQAWRALLEIEPKNQQVIQLVERTETLAAEGQLVHSLKDELADLREELAATRQARNELLMEMARVHKRYQAREARLWRLQEEREWELRDALARAELVNFTATSDEDAPPSEESTLNTQHELTENALQEAHAHIGRLREALEDAHARIDALEQDTSANVADAREPFDPLPGKSSGSSTPPSDDDTPAADGIQPSQPSSSASEPTAKRADTAANPHTQAAETDKNSPSTQTADKVPDAPADIADDTSTDAEKDAPRKTPTPYRHLTQKHTQTSHTLTVGRSFLETDEHEIEDAFAGPLISDEWLQDSGTDEAPPVPDALVHIVRKANQPEDAPGNGEDVPATGSQDDSSSMPRGAAPSPASQTSADADTEPASTASEQSTSGAPSTLGNGTPPLPADEVREPTEEAHAEDAANHVKPTPPSSSSLSSKPSKPSMPPRAPQDAPVTESSRGNIPDTAKIDAEPMDDKNLADGFADELTSALGSTPAPPRLFTGVQPELPDFDILEDAPEKMAPEDLDKYPTAIPVRHTTSKELDDPIARYLLTHVDGVSTFMELRGTVGLPPAAVDRGFRILLAHDVIRVQHQ